MELGLGLSTGWGCAKDPCRAGGLGRAQAGELALAVDKALGAPKAAGLDVALESHIVLGEDGELAAVLDVVLEVVPDTNKVLKVALVEDAGVVLDVCMVLGTAVDLEQEVDIAAAVTPDTGQDVVVDSNLEADVALPVASALGRRHPRKAAGHSSGSGV
ncbi:hypothetical protein P7K49_037305 [Saguinus oedipus]|uniref:Uncharacterized protein n=1 Tax=Saguinus oedipus TaxID=9490 RepID=A0ABQ9THP1_SAGOE|nr:hypothetical protein P7K49_037305 [Saguinus oedipus]